MTKVTTLAKYLSQHFRTDNSGSQSAALIALGLSLLLGACASQPVSAPSSGSQQGRYAMEHDSPELEPFDPATVKTVVPVAENRTIAGNKSPYTVNGRTYRVMEDEAGYVEEGMASWYGRKFHGHLTSNGEIYDMFQLSAAHTRLPIPSYLKVTNLDNNREVIVRVNDRGPFHDGRIVDLSYAAATMLGYADRGTARVRIEAVVPDYDLPSGLVAANEAPAVSPPLTDLQSVAREREKIESGAGSEYLQVGAFSNMDSARTLVNTLAGLTAIPAFVRSDPDDDGRLLHRVRLGPLNETIDVQALIRAISEARLGTPFRVRQ